jgi:hypothetical protein
MAINMHLFIIYLLVVDASCPSGEEDGMEPVQVAAKNSEGLF